MSFALSTIWTLRRQKPDLTFDTSDHSYRCTTPQLPDDQAFMWLVASFLMTMEGHEHNPSRQILPPNAPNHYGSKSQHSLISSISDDGEASRSPRPTAAVSPSNESTVAGASPLLGSQAASVPLNEEDIELAELESLTHSSGTPPQGPHSLASSHSHTGIVKFSPSDTARSWVGEVLYMIAAISALVAIVAILSRYNGRERPQWPYGDVLDLSALIALLATILRSMLAGIIESSTLLS